MSKKYQILIQVLDQIRAEATNTNWAKKYAVGSDDIDQINSARSRAYIHLYLKVMFGITEFSEREEFVTDGSYDGGIDGYYIDNETKNIYLLQSKFRITAENFEDKNIHPAEILAMDIDRITSGQHTDEAGNEYNGKIKGLIRKISELTDIARFNYKIAIIANCNLSQTHVRKLTDGFTAEIFDFSRAYNELVFPILSGTYFKASDLSIQLDLNNKSAGAKTSYSVSTPLYECEITVLFVPTLEIAKAMDKYRNSLLEYNPRSYLDLEGKTVNASITETLLRPDSNEFALMNNGLTILSDETSLNERIGQRNKAQLQLLNPQIINGGQTAYTLSRIFNEDKDKADQNFNGKEVLVKVITLTAKDTTTDSSIERMRLIEEISAATNRQTVVVTTDKLSNESIHIKLQKILFDQFGLLYERKRGEFSDGVFAGYIDRLQILERTIFMRLMLAVYGEISRAIRKKIFATHGLTEEQLLDSIALQKFNLGYELFKLVLASQRPQLSKASRNTFAKIFIGISMMYDGKMSPMEAYSKIDNAWTNLLNTVANRDSSYIIKSLDRDTMETKYSFSTEKWMKSSDFHADIKAFVSNSSASAQPWMNIS